MNVAAILLYDIVHGRRIPGIGFRLLLLGQIDAEDVVLRIRAALFVDRPGIGVIAAADYAEVAGDIVLLGVRGNDRQTVNVTFEGHDLLPL